MKAPERGSWMTRIAIELPDDIAKHLESAWGDVSRGTLEAVVLVGYRDGTLSRAQWRGAIVPGIADGVDAREEAAPEDGDASCAKPSRAGAYQWAELMRRTFGVVVLACPRCGGRLRLVALIDQASVIQRILRHLGATEVPEPRPARPPPAPLTRSRISRKMPPNSTPPGEGMASRWEGCRLGALPRFPADHIPLPSSASLPKIEADSGLIRAAEGGRG